MRKKITCIQDLFELAGGSVRLAAFLQKHFPTMSQWTVERWKKIGIPQKYWEYLIKEYDITPAELFHISNKARKL